MARLVDLHPKWMATEGRHGQGVLFDCPVHGAACNDGRIGVSFANPIDGGPPLPGRLGWQRTGETFDTLTLSPSILTHDHDAEGRQTGEHWHGYVTDGEVR